MSRVENLIDNIYRNCRPQASLVALLFDLREYTEDKWAIEFISMVLEDKPGIGSLPLFISVHYLEQYEEVQ